MRVSAIIPAYNAEATLARAIDSVLAQTRPADEIIVVDDGSRDSTAAIVETYVPRGVTLIRRENGGPSAARNAGVTEATGDLVAFLDADDWWLPEKLAVQVDSFSKYESLVVASTDWRWANHGISTTDSSGLSYLRAEEWQRPLRATGESLLRFAFSITTSTVMARRELLLRHRFDSSLPSAEDRDVWIRLVLDGDVLFDSLAMTMIMDRPDSQSNSDVDRDCKMMLLVLDRYQQHMTPAARRQWEARTYAKWASRLLAEGRPREAASKAMERLRREWWAPRGWRILGRSLIRALTAR